MNAPHQRMYSDSPPPSESPRRTPPGASFHSRFYSLVSKTLLNKLLFTELRILGPASAHALLGVTLYFCLFICQQSSWSPALPTPQREAVVGGGGQGCAGPWGVPGGSPQKQFFSAERTKVPAFLSLPFWRLGVWV